MLELAALGLLVVAVAVALTAGVFILKVFVWIVLLPVRLLVGLFVIPLLLLKLVLGGLFFLVLAPIVGLVLVAGAFALAIALLMA